MPETLEAFVKELGLEQRRYYRLSGNGPFVELYEFDWPHDKKNGRRWDHFLYVMTFTDETWTLAIDVPGLTLGDRKKALASAAKAEEAALD